GTRQLQRGERRAGSAPVEANWAAKGRRGSQGPRRALAVFDLVGHEHRAGNPIAPGEIDNHVAHRGTGDTLGGSGMELEKPDGPSAVDDGLATPIARCDERRDLLAGWKVFAGGPRVAQ